MDSNTYFANLPKEQIATALHERVCSFYEEIQRNGRLELWRKVHRYYYALDSFGMHEASGVQKGGEANELSLLKANHFRNLLQHLHVLVTQQRPSFECRAINTDYKSQVQTILGRNILEYYMREQRLDSLFRQAADVAIAYSEAYVEVEWDVEKGDTIAADLEAQLAIRSGDITARVYEPINVIRRLKADGDGRQNWYILRRWENRHDLAARAQQQEQKEKILGYNAEDNSSILDYYGYPTTDHDDDDLIPVYVFYHERTPACPLGKRVKFLGSDIVLEYGVLDYPDMPVFEMIPSRQHGTSFGYTVSFDLLCVQESIDLLYSTILSNQATFGVQNIWMKPGSNLSPTQLAGGLNILESAEKPEPINLTNTPPEIFNFLKGLETLGEVLSGVNSVARGQPEASLKSGAALALIASQAVQFSNGLQAAYVKMLEDTGTAILRTLQTRATLPRAAVIAGKDNKSYLKDFTGDDLRSINRVIVDVGNPVARTVAGRMEMAKDLLQAQVIQRPEQYIQVMETGNVEPMIEDERAEMLLINAENEALRDGGQVMAIAVDRHLQHINSHKSVLSGPAERNDPQLVARTLAHINEHINMLRTTDPALLNALGQAPIQVQPNGAPPPPQGANAPQPNAMPPPPGGPGPSPSEQAPAPQGMPPDVAAQLPNIPQAPQVA